MCVCACARARACVCVCVCVLINDLIKTSTSGICRSPDPRHLNVPEHVKNI